ncbi:MAG: hypothetical protein E7324_04050 [Clostridiales bacterium]|nr:hypothetical protein [Clostridiales bacterium]
MYSINISPLLKMYFKDWSRTFAYRLEELTREVREHNNFARRMPVVEEQIRGIHEKIHMLHPQERAGE